MAHTAFIRSARRDGTAQQSMLADAEDTIMDTNHNCYQRMPNLVAGISCTITVIVIIILLIITIAIMLVIDMVALLHCTHTSH